ncbi:thiolase family protein [Limnohabitans sp.]|uniref:thiolase family protein n=1 Tax=Limnohabitans sp. TaxID=1907725 RepID=UPI00286EBECF|nr:thiolase family protein [Limnohabitans sp.]
MSTPTPLIAAWARSAVVPRGGAFKALHAHDIAAPVVQALLQRAGLAAAHVNAIVVGNALGAGGNPARMLSLHAGLPQTCAAYTVDTQCCAGLDAVSMGIGLIASGQADVVIAGGVEAWSRAPLRMHRPLHASDEAVAYERPAFAPTAAQDPDMLLSAARFAAQHGYTRAQQEAYALHSHQSAVANQAHLAAEIVAVAGVTHDAYPRVIDAARAQRMPVVARSDELATQNADAFALSALTISAQADGAAFVLLVAPTAAARLGIQAKAKSVATASVGSAPEFPLLAAELAAREALKRSGWANADAMQYVQLHDAFAVQGLSFAEGLSIAPESLNALGGGIARGHPIGASAAIALVRLLTDLERNGKRGAQGLVAVAGAGGLGAAAVVAKL